MMKLSIFLKRQHCFLLDKIDELVCLRYPETNRIMAIAEHCFGLLSELSESCILLVSHRLSCVIKLKPEVCISYVHSMCMEIKYMIILLLSIPNEVLLINYQQCHQF